MENVKIKNDVWQNLGDVNFLTYGGCLVKKHWTEKELAEVENPELLKYIYDVFYLNPEYGEEGNQNFAALCCIDMTDDFLDWDGMLYCIGEEARIGMRFKDFLEETTISPELLAKEMVEYMGRNSFKQKYKKL